MKTMSSLLMAVTIMFMGSCKKSGPGNNSTDNPANFRLKSIRFSYKENNVVTFAITHDIVYNGNGEIAGTESSTNPGSWSTYESAGNKNSYRVYTDSVLFIIRDAFVKAGTTLVDSAFEINTNLKDTTEIKYHYNDANQLVSSDEINHSHYGVDMLTHTDYTYDGNGNLTKEVENFDGSIYTTTYTYDMAIPVTKSGPDGYYPRTQQQMPTGSVYKSPYEPEVQIFYEYTFDSHHRVTGYTTSWSKYPDQQNLTEYVYY
jgi:hypothetical protein